MKPKVFITLGVVALALVAALLMYERYLTKPWTRDAYVRANVVGVAPRVAKDDGQAQSHQLSHKSAVF